MTENITQRNNYEFLFQALSVVTRASIAVTVVFILTFSWNSWYKITFKTLLKALQDMQLNCVLTISEWALFLHAKL